MKTIMIFISLMFIIISVATCGGEDQSPEKLCEILVDCNASSSQDDCLQGAGSLELSDECKDEMFAATCEEHTSNPPPYLNTCFLPCTTEGRSCHGDYLHSCQNGTEMIYDCFSVCKYQIDGFYSGVCGEFGPNGEISDIGIVCWCRD